MDVTISTKISKLAGALGKSKHLLSQHNSFVIYLPCTRFSVIWRFVGTCPKRTVKETNTSKETGPTFLCLHEEFMSSVWQLTTCDAHIFIKARFLQVVRKALAGIVPLPQGQHGNFLWVFDSPCGRFKSRTCAQQSPDCSRHILCSPRISPFRAFSSRTASQPPFVAAAFPIKHNLVPPHF